MHSATHEEVVAWMRRLNAIADRGGGVTADNYFLYLQTLTRNVKVSRTLASEDDAKLLSTIDLLRRLGEEENVPVDQSQSWSDTLECMFVWMKRLTTGSTVPEQRVFQEPVMPKAALS